MPEKTTFDKSSANTDDIERVKADVCVDTLMQQNKHLNNIARQEHRAVKRVTRPMLGYMSFWSNKIFITGIETMRMLRKGQMDCPGTLTVSAVNQFYSLSARLYYCDKTFKVD